MSGTAEVQGMEEVRSVLQSMLRLPKESAAFGKWLVQLDKQLTETDTENDLSLECEHMINVRYY